MRKIVDITEDDCIGCGTCIEICPNNILYLDDETDKCKVTDETKCDKFRGCEKECPTGAIKIH
jgi:NAD-dependent dihydropyrimidine dehydrogenase PreA subunit